MKKHFFSGFIGLLTITVLSLSSCKPDTQTATEFITRIVLHMENTNGFSQDFVWEDANGDGIPESIDTIALAPNTAYTCTVHVYDDTVDPVNDITAEIKAENTAHLLVYTAINADVAIVRTDADDNGAPFGLATQWNTGANSSGKTNIRLIHEPDKSASDPTATGETDFEVEFPTRIQ
ncbi:MAG: hypothetical protein IPL65_10430 [Lewinellaceae bacterium]|nr:hypothetical protein [Lewinellaceae bacterium]